MSSRRPKILGQLLVDNEGVAPEAVKAALGSDRRPRERIGEALVRLGETTPDAVVRALGVQLGLDVAGAPIESRPDALRAVHPELGRLHRLVPLELSGRTIRVAMADPLDLVAIDDVQFQTGRRVEPVVATAAAVDEAITRCFGSESAEDAALDSTEGVRHDGGNGHGHGHVERPRLSDVGTGAPGGSDGRARAGTSRRATDDRGSDGPVGASGHARHPRRGGRGDDRHGPGAPVPRLTATEPHSNDTDDFSTLVDALPDVLRTPSRVTTRDGVDQELEEATRQAPVVRLVDRILRSAIDDGASDIHVEETGIDVRVRLRIDGRLRQTLDLPAGARRAILSRIKVVAGMDIAVRRRAQDGRLSLSHDGRRLTLRVSTLPVNGGEKAVVRILDPRSTPRDMSGLGMAPTDLAQLRRLLARGEGVLLAAGPTGSGKSTTLFAALSEIDRDVRNVVTLEDPVEYRLPGASQIQVDRRAGLGFAEALRAVLRQDPDVVMIGEIRDRETAEIAMAAAVTGHLVLSTIHTTDAPGAVTRLLHMGVPPFLVAGGLSGVVAQRLVRKSCDACRARGCPRCHDGLRGRTGVYQVLTVSDAIRDEISGGGSSARLRRLAAEVGMTTLASDARRAVAAGLTTPHEVTDLLDTAATAGVPCSDCSTPVPFGALACPRCGKRRRRQCACGKPAERGWRYCPWCLRPLRTP